MGIRADAIEPLCIFIDHHYQLESHIFRLKRPDGDFSNAEPEEHDVVAWKKIADMPRLLLSPGLAGVLSKL